MNSTTYHLVKRDVNSGTSIEIATYRVVQGDLEGGQKYVICKNDKRIGWAMEEVGALQIHDMYARIHVFHEDNSGTNDEQLIREMRSKPQDNSFLHDFADTKI